jgi:hypothetical protein
VRGVNVQYVITGCSRKRPRGELNVLSGDLPLLPLLFIFGGRGVTPSVHIRKMSNFRREITPGFEATGVVTIVLTSSAKSTNGKKQSEKMKAKLI